MDCIALVLPVKCNWKGRNRRKTLNITKIYQKLISYEFRNWSSEIILAIFLKIIVSRKLLQYKVIIDHAMVIWCYGFFVAGWKGGNREFLWYAIEDRFSHEYAYAYVIIFRSPITCNKLKSSNNYNYLKEEDCKFNISTLF